MKKSLFRNFFLFHHAKKSQAPYTKPPRSMKMIEIGFILLPLIAATKAIFSSKDEENAEVSYLHGGEPCLSESDVSVDSLTASFCLNSESDISIDESCTDQLTQFELCNLLGPIVPEDSALNVGHPTFSLPSNYDAVIVIDLPVGYFRARRAFLSSSSNFWTESILRNALKYEEVESTKWDHHDQGIGLPNLSRGVRDADLIGASRTISYVMPAGKLVGASMATEIATLTEHNDDFFAIQMKTATPGVPFGKKFLALTQIVIINNGGNTCQMICSVEPVFPDGPPLGMKGQIKRGMKSGTIAMFEKIGAHIKNCATSYGC
mmetsp:Transcript_3383/g.4982  ORF Transcript_3383/g.4982 Transcript_3383/m.4982 type:complete len:320 (+) Transcript_3383:588-1547(+)